MGNEAKIIPGIEGFDRSAWNRLSAASAPIMDWEYLYCLEASGSVSPAKSYTPFHIGVFSGGSLVAAAPLYYRPRAWVEFGDGGLLEFLTDITGIPFREGLVAGIPFTPVPGYQFLHDPALGEEAAYAIVLREIDAICTERRFSTSRVYFVSADSPLLHRMLMESGYLRITSPYLLWVNRGYRDFGDYLKTFKSSRRTKIKREVRTVRESGIMTRMIDGLDSPSEYYDAMHSFYRHTWLKYMGSSIEPFLNAGFFRLLDSEFRSKSGFCVSSKNGERLALALFYYKGDRLFGRYWGALAEIAFLHFTTCYYFPIEYGIQHGVRTIDPGFGGEHKESRGFEPTPVFHYIKFFGERERRVAKAVLSRMGENVLG